MSELYGFDLLAEKRKSVGESKEKQDAQRTSGKLTARERITKLLDSESFVETDALAQQSNSVAGLKEVSAPGEGVVTGYGTIDGRGVYVFSEDHTVLGGAMGAMHAKKIVKVMDMAGKTGLPVIALLDSMGARLGEGAGALEAYASVICKMTELSGVVPIITAVCGTAAGTASYLVPLSDFVFMTQDVSSIFTSAPASYNKPGSDTDLQAIGGAALHATTTGLTHFKCDSENDTFYYLKQLLGFLPDNNLVDAPYVEGDDVNRQITNYQGAYDIREMINSVMDNGVFFETQAFYAMQILTGFARVGGRSVGVVANNPGASLDGKACSKAAGFISFCDAFGIPIITFTDTPGFDTSKNPGCIIKSGAKLMYAYAQSSVAMVNVITGKAIGAGYVAMSPRSMGADMVFAWPNAVISCLPMDAAADILMRGDIAGADEPSEARKQAADTFAKTFASPWEAAKMGYVDEVIYPSETRQRIAGALELAVGKREGALPKKHGTRMF
ncbi:MAG: methylmalonyl-CoA carboxyltransferase [Clostridia bacterium]|jgi:methylmalonyl-CoA decarboxylase subunit alpha|nr:methylmalonyl-CoA carboxyltransferase [Clostridia bacterium]MBT7122568.1 methylmalonyl-CoA carboxyltransferase [Clostridia bacterium]